MRTEPVSGHLRTMSNITSLVNDSGVLASSDHRVQCSAAHVHREE